MISDENYMNTFFITITLLVILGVTPSFRYKNLSSFPDMNLVVGTVLLLVISTLFIGLRNPFGSFQHFGDTHSYTLLFQQIKNDPLWSPQKDFGFYFYMKILASFFSIQMFYLITAILYVFLVYFAFVKWFKKYAYFALIIHVSSMSFWPYGINGMRNGLAASIFIFALSFYHRKWIMALLVALAVSFHASMMLPTVALIIVYFFDNTKILLRIWALSIPLCFFLGKKIDSSLRLLFSSTVGSFDFRADYTGYEELIIDAAAPKFKLNFVFYSSLVIVLGYYFIYKLNFKHEFYQRMFNLYLIANTVWLYFIYFPFTNRFAYLSWFLIPVLAIFPIIYSTKLKNQSYFMAGAVSVSLFFAWIVAFV